MLKVIDGGKKIHGFKFRIVNSELNLLIQHALFLAGYRWEDNGSFYNHWREPFLYAESNKKLKFGDSTKEFQNATNIEIDLKPLRELLKMLKENKE